MPRSGATRRGARSRARATLLAARPQARLNRDLAEGDAQAESILHEQRQKIRQFIKDAAKLKVSDVANSPPRRAASCTPSSPRRTRARPVDPPRLPRHCRGEHRRDLQHGLDPNRRGQHGQAHGRGEYFAENSGTSVAHCQGGKKMIVFAVLMHLSGLTKRTNGIVVINKVEHQLPMFVLTCDASSAN